MNDDIKDENIIDDVEFSPDEESSNANTLSGESKLKKQKEKLEKLESEKNEYLLNWQKERADFLNYKKEEISRIEYAKNLGFEKGIMGIINMLDTFDMAFANKDAWNNVEANWRTGVEYIYNQGVKFLEESNIKIISPVVGTDTDPNIHDVVESEKTEDENLDGKVSKTVQKGYTFKDKIIRPAKISVYKI